MYEPPRPGATNGGHPPPARAPLKWTGAGRARPSSDRTGGPAIDAPQPAAVRLAHFSDVHVTAPACVWRRGDWFNKRLSAWANLRLLGRGQRFRQADRAVAALADDLRARRFDRVLFSGDASAMGFEEELARAAHLLRVGDPQPPGLAVPGNHDYCTRHAMHAAYFERYFAPWQAGERVDSAVYPFAQRVGPAWVIGVNSSTANRWAWDASGRVGGDQLRRLEALLARLDGCGPRILVTHYPVWLASGRRERGSHGLRDLDELVAVAQRGGVSLWLHGHRHDTYHHHPSEYAPFPVICAGSATQRGHWSYSEYTLSGDRLGVLHRVFDEKAGRFRDGRSFELTLPGKW